MWMKTVNPDLMRAADLNLHCFQKRQKKFGEVLPTVHLLVKYGSIYILGPSIPGLVTDIQVNVYIGNTLLSFQN